MFILHTMTELLMYSFHSVFPCPYPFRFPLVDLVYLFLCRAV